MTVVPNTSVTLAIFFKVGIFSLRVHLGMKSYPRFAVIIFGSYLVVIWYHFALLDISWQSQKKMLVLSHVSAHLRLCSNHAHEKGTHLSGLVEQWTPALTVESFA